MASMPKLRLCLVFPHVVLGGGETAMMEVAAGLREKGIALDVCALDNLDTGAATIREELVARFGAATFVRRRWELRLRLREADLVLWYGVSNAVPATLSVMEPRPGSIRVVHTDRAVDGPGFARRWRRAIDAIVCVSPGVARRIPGAVFISNHRLAGPPERRAPGILRRLRAADSGLDGAPGAAEERSLADRKPGDSRAATCSCRRSTRRCSPSPSW